MTSIDRTAYPNLKATQIISDKTLTENYSLNTHELEYIKNSVRSNKLRLHFALQFKIFQNLGLFIDVEQAPQMVVAHLKKQLAVPHNLHMPVLNLKTLYRHRQSIRQHFGWTPWGLKGPKSARRFAIQSAYKAAQTLNIPADIINVVIEELKINRFEIPAFSTLCRLVRHVRSRANRTLFKQTFDLLTHAKLIPILDELIVVSDDKKHSAYQMLKEPPKSPRIKDFKEQIRHHSWVDTLGNVGSCVKHISKQKYLQFVQEAKSLDISNLMDISESRRYTLIACLIDYTKKETKDNLAEVFCKTMATIHKKARIYLTKLQEKATDKTQEIAWFAHSILGEFKDNASDKNAFLKNVSATIKESGGVDELMKICAHIIACHSNQHYPLLWKYFKSKRVAIFDVVETIEFGSSTQRANLINAINFLISLRHKRSETIKAPSDLSLDFISDIWRKLVYEGKPENNILKRRYFEMCVFTYLSYELTSGDIFIEGADSFSDYRTSLLSREECQEILEKEPESASLPFNGNGFIEDLKKEMIEKSKVFDDIYPSLSDFTIDDKGIGSLKKVPVVKPTPKTLELVAQIKKNMPERTLLDILCSTHHITGWAFEFGPISGSEARFDEPINRYILNTFCHGTGMGPAQTAKHVRSDTELTPHMLSWVNQRHVTINSLNKAKDCIVNFTKDFPITKAWGDGSRCAADGTLRDIYEDNILAESHFRYVSKGGICYNHVADTYVALFSTFMRCGLWEAVAILDGLLQNDSTVKPTTIHADTQGQSTVVFGLAHLLGIKLMPRIRNWKKLIFYKADPDIIYKNVDQLFSESIDWELIKTHWPDLIQVVLSIKYGKISSALLLKKLGTYSRKNKLYQAFQELGRVIRTIFLLEYLSNLKLREIITATTNKVEAYNELSAWVFFAGDVIVSSNDPEEMEKAIKYNLLISNCIILQNIIDLTDTIHKLQSEGIIITMEDMSRLSPYLTSHIKRFGEFVLDLEVKPMDAEWIKNLKIFG